MPAKPNQPNSYPNPDPHNSPTPHPTGDTFHWLDVDRIAEDLTDAHPNQDPLTVNFVDLRAMVEALPGFDPQPEHPVNERILETIQALWNQEFRDLPTDDD